MEEDEFYLKIALYPTIEYPTEVYDSTFLDTLSTLKRTRIEIIPSKYQLLSVPIPRFNRDHLIPMSTLTQSIEENAEVFVHVDTAGLLSIMRSSTQHKPTKSNIALICKRSKFFPAINFDGKKVDYYGYIKFNHFNESYIRISYLWL